MKQLWTTLTFLLILSLGLIFGAHSAFAQGANITVCQWGPSGCVVVGNNCQAGKLPDTTGCGILTKDKCQGDGTGAVKDKKFIPCVAGATACCTKGHYEENASFKGCCEGLATCLPGYHSSLTRTNCSPAQACDARTNTCSLSVTKTPECPKGTKIDATDPNMCCTDWIPQLAIPGVLEVPFAACKKNTPRVARDYCSPTATARFEYNKISGQCDAVKPAPVWLCFDDKGEGCDTALGKIKTDPGEFVGFILQYALIITGLSIILVLIAIGYRVLTSGGEAEKLQSAKELATSLVGGVVLIIFSLVILRAIGVDILGLPGFQ